MLVNWKKVLLPLIILGLGAGGYSAIKANAKKPEEKKVIDTRPTVEVKTLAAKDYAVTIRSHGEVKPLEQTRLAAQVSGEVIAWHKDFVPGGLVKRGEVLFEIAPENYEAAVLQAEAELFRAESALVEEKAKAKVAEEEVRRIQGKQRTDLFLRKPQLLSAEAAVKSAQAGLMRARRDLANCRIKAPYDALIVSREIGTGQFINVGAPVAVLSNIESAEIMIPIAGFDHPFLPDTTQGAPASVHLNPSSPVERPATLMRDLGVIDEATRMSYLVVRLSDPYSLNTSEPPIPFGSFVEVRFTGKTLPHVHQLPQEAVNRQTVWLVGDASRLEPRSVQIIREEGVHFLVNSGLEDGERLVLTLPEYPQKGMEVKIAEGEAL